MVDWATQKKWHKLRHTWYTFSLNWWEFGILFHQKLEEFGILFGMAEKEKWKGPCGHPEFAFALVQGYCSA